MGSLTLSLRLHNLLRAKSDFLDVVGFVLVVHAVRNHGVPAFFFGEGYVVDHQLDGNARSLLHAGQSGRRVHIERHLHAAFKGNVRSLVLFFGLRRRFK